MNRLCKSLAATMVVVPLAGHLGGCSSDDDAASDPTIASTQEGTVLGVSNGSVVSFKGIPYAAPPVGALRWKAPAPAASRSTMLRADTDGGTCITQEDCLYLNVYRPQADSTSGPRPVLLWIHGGGFVNGAGSQFDGSSLAADNGFVVVTINYRLSGLGFLAHPALTAESGTSGNYAILDQQAAIRWAKTNIAQFGGDPNNVTIMGESAGGVSIATQLASPLAAGLFNKAVVLSGAYLRVQPTLAAGEAAGKSNAERLGCPGIDAAAAQCLRQLTLAQIRSGTSGAASGTWSPLIDGKVLVESTSSAFASGRFNRVPTIMGANRDEETVFATFLLPQAGLTGDTYAPFASSLSTATAAEILATYPASQYLSPARAAFQALGDYRFVCGMVGDVSQVAKYVPNTWQYEFAEQNPVQSVPGAPGYPGPELAAIGPFGNYHSASLDYWFNQFQTADQRTPTNLALSSTMRSFLANFGRTGNPNGTGLPAWREAVSNLGIGFGTPVVADVNTAARHQCGLWQTKTPSDRLI